MITVDDDGCQAMAFVLAVSVAPGCEACKQGAAPCTFPHCRCRHIHHSPAGQLTMGAGGMMGALLLLNGGQGHTGHGCCCCDVAACVFVGY